MPTIENCDELQAGMELDMLIAKEVMGCELEHMTKEFYPSTNITAAWKVVEHLRMRGFFQFQVWNYLYVWHASFANADFGLTDLEVEAPTAPLAICRAAIRARRS